MRKSLCLSILCSPSTSLGVQCFHHSIEYSSAFESPLKGFREVGDGCLPQLPNNTNRLFFSYDIGPLLLKASVMWATNTLRLLANYHCLTF